MMKTEINSKCKAIQVWRDRTNKGFFFREKNKHKYCDEK